MHRSLLFSIALLVIVASASAAQVITTTTYQGRIDDGGSPFTGLVDVHIELFAEAAGGVPVAILASELGVAVEDGLFQVPLDVPQNSKVGAARFIEVSLRRDGDKDYTVLAPRQPLRPAPDAGDTPGARVGPSGEIIIRPDVPEVVPAVDILSVAGGVESLMLTDRVRQIFIAEQTGAVEFLRLGLVKKAATFLAVSILNEQENAIGEVTYDPEQLDYSFSIVQFPGDPVMLSEGEKYTIEVRSFGVTGLPAQLAVEVALDPDAYAAGEAESFDPAVPLINDLAARVEMVDPSPGVRVTSIPGDDAVILPEGSVNPLEITGEAGIVPSGPPTTLTSRTVVAPADGYFLALVGGTVAVTSSSNTSDMVIGLSKAGGAGPNDYEISLRGNGGSDRVVVPLFLHGTYPVTAGETIEVTLTRSGAGFLQGPEEVQFTLLFFPTDYTPASP